MNTQERLRAMLSPSQQQGLDKVMGHLFEEQRQVEEAVQREAEEMVRERLEQA